MSLEGFAQLPFASVLLDAAKARAIRLEFENGLAAGTEGTLNYMPAVTGAAQMAPFAHSTLAVIEMPLELLRKTADGKLNIKAASLNQGGDAIEADDYLGEGLSQWTKIEALPEALAFNGMEEFSAVPSTGAANVILPNLRGTWKSPTRGGDQPVARTVFSRASIT